MFFENPHCGRQRGARREERGFYNGPTLQFETLTLVLRNPHEGLKD
jgi:hypothetical protein